MKTKKGFNRFVSVLLSFAIVISTFAGLSLNWFEVAASGESQVPMHIIITQWHTVNEAGDVPDGGKKAETILDGYLWKISEGVYKFNDSATESSSTNKAKTPKGEVNYNFSELTGVVTITATPRSKAGKALEKYAGFSVSAGHTCVDVTDAGDDSTMTITYDPNIHLVKAHTFYTNTSMYVAGATNDLVSGAGGAGFADGRDTFYGYMDDDGNIKPVDAEEALDSDGRIKKEYKGQELTKYYSTAEGLHTDKTAMLSVMDDLTGRTFDLNLEAWFVGNKTANVGLILDASGSMVSPSSDDLEPIPVTAGDLYKALGVDEAVGCDLLDENGFLLPEVVDKLLDPKMTDTSPLGVSGFTYYLYDAKNGNNDFFPLGYWNGVDKGTNEVTTEGAYKYDIPKIENLIGYYSFNESDSKYSNMLYSGGTVQATKVAKQDIASFDASKTTSNNYNFSGNGFQLTTDGGLLLKLGEDGNTLLTGNFTITFKIKRSKDDSKPNCKNILYIGPSTGASENYFTTYRNGDSSSSRLVCGNGPSGVKADATYSNINSVFSKNDWNYITYVYEDGKLYSYLNGSVAVNSGENLAPNDGKEVSLSKENVIVINGLSDTYNGQEIDIDEFYVFDTALGKSDVKDMYTFQSNSKNTNISDIKEKTTKTTGGDKYLAKNGDDVLGTIQKSVYDKAEKVEESDSPMRGWYYVSFGSAWDDGYFTDVIGTAKDYRHVYGPASVYISEDEKDKKKNGLKYDLVYKYNSSDFGKQAPKDFKGIVFYYDPDKCYTDNTESEFDHETSSHTTIDPGNDKEIRMESLVYRPTTDTSTSDNNPSPIKFFVDSKGYLCCFFATGRSDKDMDGSYGWSYVFKKADTSTTKVEALQDALGNFTSNLLESSLKSKVSAVRFSSGDIDIDADSDKLVLLDWTSDPVKASEMLSLQYGVGDKKGTSISPTVSKNGKNQYNYGLTGGTVTQNGIKSYIDNLKEEAEKDTDAEKYLIIFTDGKDTKLSVKATGADGKVTQEDVQTAIGASEAYKQLEDLKADGYTIFCVMLTGGVMKESTTGEIGDYEQAYQFLVALSSDEEYTGTDGDYKHTFIASADELTSMFNTISEQISENLEDYTVQDYIDPRFDLVDKDGKVWHLNAGGSVVVGDPTTGEKKTVTKDSGAKIDIRGGDTDSSTATLYYDNEANMYFLRWDKQNIPSCVKGDSSLKVWSSTVTIRAKDDFIGGNAVLTNGNGPSQNYVYKNGDTGATSGTGTSTRPPEDVTADVSKGFPRTAVNVKVPSLDIVGDEQTIYMGEELTPDGVAKKLGETITDRWSKDTEDISKWYWEYLSRYAKKYSDTYKNGLDDIIAEIVAAATDPANADKSKSYDYFYIPKVDDSNQTGDAAHHELDKLGTLVFKWTTVYGDDAHEYPADKVTTDTLKRVSALTVTYIPLLAEESEGVKDREDYNKENVHNEGDVYPWDPKYKPAPGTATKKIEAEEGDDNRLDDTGTYTTDIVAGEIILDWKFLDETTIKILQNHFKGAKITYTADLIRNYDGIASEKVGTFTFEIDCSATDLKENNPLKATFDPDPSYESRIPKYGLPIGSYTLDVQETTVTGTGIGASLAAFLKEHLTFTDKAIEITDTYKKDFDGYNPEPSGSIALMSALENLGVDWANYKAEISSDNKAIYLGWNGSEKTTDGEYIDDRLGMFLVTAKLDVGSLSITKTVTDNVNEEIDAEQEFTFHVEFKDGATGANIPGSFSYTIGGETKSITDGEGEIKLKSGQTAKFDNLPYGTYYTVTEVDMATGYAPENAEQKGVIGEEKADITFVNVYGIDGELTLNFIKNLLGRDWNEDETFTFVLTPADTTTTNALGTDITVTEATLTDGTIVVTAENGEAIPVKLAFARNTEGGLPITYIFKVKENVGTNTDNMEYSEEEYIITIVLSEGDKYDGKYDVVAKYTVKDSTRDGTDVTKSDIPFNNQAKVDWSFDITKDLVGRNWKSGDEFSFGIELEEARSSTGEKVTDFTKSVTINNDSENHKGKVDVTFYSTGTYTFTVTENPGTDGNIVYDTSEHKIVVVVTDDSGELAVTSVTVDGEEAVVTATDLTITNNYKVSGEASIDVSVEKELTGRDWLSGEKFEFTIEAADDATKAAVNETDETKEQIKLPDNITVDSQNGTAKFDAIEFKNILLGTEKSRTFKFTISEVNDGKTGITYAENSYEVTITITDDGSGTGKLVYEVEVAGPDDGGNMKFVNHSDPAKWSPSVKKDLTGREWNSDSFTFTLTADSNNPDGSSIEKGDSEQVIVSDANAKKFDAVEFTKPGEYKFTITEDKPTELVNGKLNGVTYSNTTYVVTVTVTDNGLGKLYVETVEVGGTEQSDPNDVKLSFTNTYTAEGEATFTVQKTLTGRDWKEGDKFTFTLTPDTKNPEGAKVYDENETEITDENKIELTNGNEKSFTIKFENLFFDKDEAEKIYTFTLKEDIGNIPGMTYDKTEYKIVVTVTDKGDGEINTKVTVNEKENATAMFTNSYSADKVTWTPNVEKTLDGRDWIEGDEFTFNIQHTPIDGEPEDGVTMPTNTKATASGTISTNTAANASFDAIEFTKAGKYGFTISEVKPTEPIPGVTYSETKYEVTVTIADDGEGNLYVYSISYDTTKIEKEDVDSHKFSFTNTYTDKPVDWTVSINKILEGREGDWLDGIDVFKFFISPENDYGTNVDMPTKNYIQIDKNSKNTEGVRSAYFDTITFNKKGDYTFKVYEEQGTAGGILYDSTEHILTVHVGSDNKGNLVITSVEHDTDADHAGVDETWTGSSAENVQLTFVNHHSHKAVDWKPSVQKTLSGRDWVKGDSFKFRITYNGVVDKNKIIMPTDTTTSVVSSESKSFNTIRFVEIGEYTFTVNEELTSDQAAKGLTKDTKAYTIVVTVKSYNGTETGHEDGELYIERITVNGEDYDPAKDVVLPFTNKYSASGTADLTVQKTLEGKEWNGDNFTFTLTPDADYEGVTLPEIGLSSAAEKIFKINFKDITFDSGNSKVYNFTLTENGGNYPGMIYDKTKYTIKVTVTDNHDGTISSTVEVVGTEDNVAAFKNTYEPNSTKWTPKVSKTLSGREWKDGDSFTFSIALDRTSDYVTFTEGGKTVIISGTDAEKIKSFGEITFTKAGTYAFTVSEEGTDGNGLTYDKHVYKVNVTVTDNGNGSLKISSITYEDSQVSDKFDDITFEFVNKYEPKPVDWTPSVTKVITYKPTWESNYKFDFTITPPTGTDGVKYAENTVTADSEHHTVNFPTVTFTAAGKYEFTVQEKQGDISAVKYDTAPHKIIVTVEDINGTLNITDVSGTDTGSDSNLTITNTYSTKVSWPPLVEKNIDGKYWKDGDAFTFTLSLAPDSPDKVGPEAMPDDITLTFADVVSLKKAEKAFEGVKFTEPGTYKFILKESTQSSGNMICDSSQYIITVVVTRDDNGELVVSPSAMKQDASGYTQEAGSYSFTNTYKPEQTDVTIYVEKELDGWKDNDGGFTFDITLTNGNSANVIMPDLTFLTVTKDVPTASFGKIIFTAEGDYEFTVAEREGTNDKIIYAKSQKVTVKVRADESTGKLVASVDGGDSTKTLKFVNHYISNTKLPKGTIIITKVLENWKDGDSFTFEIKLTSGNAESVVFADNIATVTATKDAPTASFGDIIFTAEGEYTFTITELSNADDGIIYDTSEYTVTVNVKRDDEHYTLQITDGLNEVNFTFTNSYKTSDDPTPPDEDGDEDEDNPSTGVLPNLTALATATLAMATALFLKKKRSKK